MLLRKTNVHIKRRTKAPIISLQKKKLSVVFKAHIIRRTKVHKIFNKKKKVPSNGKFKAYLKSWYKFCNHCTIDGLKLIAGYSSKLSIKNRITILFYFLAVCGMMLYLCVKNVQTYLLFNPKTTITYNFRNKLTFPTVSLSNENRFQRSYVGGNNLLMTFLITNIVVSMDNMLANLNYFTDLVI